MSPTAAVDNGERCQACESWDSLQHGFLLSRNVHPITMILVAAQALRLDHENSSKSERSCN
jgi:hypothetical protein